MGFFRNYCLWDFVYDFLLVCHQAIEKLLFEKILNNVKCYHLSVAMIIRSFVNTLRGNLRKSRSKHIKWFDHSYNGSNIHWSETLIKYPLINQWVDCITLNIVDPAENIRQHVCPDLTDEHLSIFQQLRQTNKSTDESTMESLPPDITQTIDLSKADCVMASILILDKADKNNKTDKKSRYKINKNQKTNHIIIPSISKRHQVSVNVKTELKKISDNNLSVEEYYKMLKILIDKSS